MVHIYTGDGKGKTTCAAGLSARCAGRGGKVAFFQFLKNNDSGEFLCLKDKVDFFHHEWELGFVYKMAEPEKSKAKSMVQLMWEMVKKHKEDYDLIVLDEIIPAVNWGFIEETELLLFAEECKAEIILTGRDASAKLVNAADYVSEIKKIKHPFDRGVSARCGIEK